ncbi:MAG: Mur ligase [Planctomycetes bacterium]|nr:Mur ligase [Planctomycetota bacterium]
MSRLFFSGLAGAGMNPLAQLMRAWGHEVVGSDRGFDQGSQPELRARLVAQGITVVPQDGAAIVAGIDRVIYSTAVEGDTPELSAAKRLGIPLQSRPQLLADVVNQARPGVAIAGTSGKSTVTGMIAWILRRAEHTATVLGGAALAGEGVAGCFAVGEPGGAAVAEACESDGTLIGYRPTIGVIHNITRDHAEIGDLRRQFATFASQCGLLLVNNGCAEAAAIAAGHAHVRSYALHAQADVTLEVVSPGPHRARGVLNLPDGRELAIDLPQPGTHNLENAAAAALVALECGIALEVIAGALADFPGVARRFQVVGITDSGIRVVDDYAHNGDKIRAAVTAAQAGCDRLVAIFKPHGFGPARFLRRELAQLLPKLLRPHDRFCYAEIFYAGGTVAKDISSRDLAADLPASMRCGYAQTSAEVLSWTADAAGAGDTVLVMGARDPDLPKLARAIYELL